MKSYWTLLLVGIVGAVAAAFIVEWLNRVLKAPTRSANEVAWQRRLNADTGCTMDSGLLPNFNESPCNPAWTYPFGAPVTNFRQYRRVGVLTLPTCDTIICQKANFA